MVSSNGDYVLTYNGEVYNFHSIRRDLEQQGYTFRSQTDSEVVLNAYIEWGEECVTRFNGMFAFAIWDKSKQELFIARDRYGTKPLYYAFFDDVFVFASEQKAILRHPAANRDVDLEALIEYFTFQNIFTDRTFFKKVSLLPPGHWAKVAFGAPCFTALSQYWDFSFREPVHPATEGEYLEELDRLFNQSIQRHMVSDVDVGSYLSGGIDSGAITAIAAKHLPYIKTFTCGFDLHSASGLELGFDERQKSEAMSYLFKTEHYEMVLKAGDMERVLPKMSWHLEEPRVGQSYPNYYMAQLASKFVKVVFSGSGGDELFGGYPWRYYRAVVNDDFDQYIDKYYSFWQRLLNNQESFSVFQPIWSEVKDVSTKDIFKSVFRTSDAVSFHRPEDYINHSLYFEAKTFLHGLLVVEDKLSMAHGLETRVPFLDNDLVDFAMQIPVNLKLKRLTEIVKLNENDTGPKTSKYYERTGDGKLIFRNMMKRYIPSEITEAVKQGFSAPDASWFKGESIEYVRETLYNNNSLIYQFFDRKSVLNIVNEHLEGHTNRRLFIWSLLNFENWCKQYLL